MPVTTSKAEHYFQSLQKPHVMRSALNAQAMSVTPLRQHILVVEDELGVRETMALVLASGGYKLATAIDGLDALLKLKRTLPQLLLCDLEMPRMSGFELLSIVRRRFPEIAVVAMSGRYEGDSIPSGVVADAFYAKGRNTPEGLLRIVAEVIRTAHSRAEDHIEMAAPVWAPRIGSDARGTPSVLVTCTECLRSFPLAATGEDTTVMKTKCIFCLNDMSYVIGSPHSQLCVANTAMETVIDSGAANHMKADSAKFAGRHCGQEEKESMSICSR